ncbi:metal-dependent hydrolase [Micromonospora sp. DT227]|uniref:metal-dependent hydrolase n=1 Tax=Micromonospora sp. DT227 TaxID=3393433 RepID=UPI003CF3C06D
MMARTHCWTSAASWLAGCAFLPTIGHPPSISVALAGAAVTAGASLIPDIDFPRSTISWSGGPATQRLAQRIGGASARLQVLTCEHCARRGLNDGHRGITHTLVFAAVVALLLASGVALVGGWVAGPVIWATVGLAVRGVLPWQLRGRFGASVFAAVATVAVVVASDGVWWWVPAAVGWGVLAHSLGDSLSVAGVPLLWPLRLRGCRWYRTGLRRWHVGTSRQSQGAAARRWGRGHPRDERSAGSEREQSSRILRLSDGAPSGSPRHRSSSRRSLPTVEQGRRSAREARP